MRTSHVIRRRKIIQLVTCVVLINGGCEQPRNVPKQNIPELPRAIGTLRMARNSAVATAGLAKAQFRRRKLYKGEQLYGIAAATHNAAIAEISASLGQPKALMTERLNMLLQEADTQSKAFHDWYSPPNSVGGQGQAQSANAFIAVEGIVVDLLALNADLTTIEHEKAQEQLRELRRQLKACEWPRWSSVASTVNSFGRTQ